MPIEVTANNPLGITIAGPGYGNANGAPSYGASGTVTSGLGYTFDSFSTPQAGIQAALQYLQKYIGQPIGAVISKAFNGDQSAVQSLGLNLNDPVSSSNIGLLAAGISKGEGTLNAFGGVGAFTNGVSSAISTITNPVGAAASAIGIPTGLFTLNTAERTIAIVIAIILIGIAMIFLLGQTKTGQTVIETAKTAVTTAAVAA